MSAVYGHADGHVGDLALERGDHGGAGFGRPCGGGDDVEKGAPTPTPALLGGAVHQHLYRCHGVQGGRKRLLYAERIVTTLTRGTRPLEGQDAQDTYTISALYSTSSQTPETLPLQVQKVSLS